MKAKRKSKDTQPGAGDIVLTPPTISNVPPPPVVRKRPNLTIRLTPKLYAQIQEAADQAGRSLSEEVERRLERADEWDAMFGSAAAFRAKFKIDCAELERDHTEAVLPSRGYTKVMDSRYGGHVWAPPERQRIPQGADTDIPAGGPPKAITDGLKTELERLEKYIQSLQPTRQKDDVQ
jgi:hypothetical protein